MDDIERNSRVQRIQPVRKIRARIYDRERRGHTHLNKKLYRAQLKRKKGNIKETEEHLTADASTPEAVEQDLKDYKSDLKTRLAFDRAQILPEGPSSD